QSLFKAFAGSGPRLFRFLFGQCKKEHPASPLGQSRHFPAAGRLFTFAKRCKSNKKTVPLCSGGLAEQLVG
ncbi:MAG: hypothetical protein E6X17_14950, partial [Sporomusaceae bacterium]|nr:hypothetical protein [Sporomusaceae bacterium]